MTWSERQTSGIGIEWSTNWASTTAKIEKKPLFIVSYSGQNYDQKVLHYFARKKKL